MLQFFPKNPVRLAVIFSILANRIFSLPQFSGPLASGTEGSNCFLHVTFNVLIFSTLMLILIFWCTIREFLILFRYEMFALRRWFLPFSTTYHFSSILICSLCHPLSTSIPAMLCHFEHLVAPSFATLLQGPLLSRAGTADLSHSGLDFIEIPRD